MNKLAYYRNKADKAMQEYYRKQKLKCAGCGQPAQLMHHYFPKSIAASLRYDEDNLVPACSKCHYRHHEASSPRLHAGYLLTKPRDFHQKLEKKKQEIVKPSQTYYKSIIEKYDKD